MVPRDLRTCIMVGCVQGFKVHGGLSISTPSIPLNRGYLGSTLFGDTVVPNITPIMENQMEKKMENEMETGMI